MIALPSQGSQGFTLIELMATMIIGIILLVGGGAAVLRAQDRQQAETVATELQRFMVQTRARARAQDREGCPGTPGVIGYEFSFDNTTNPTASAKGLCGPDKWNPALGAEVATYSSNASVVIVPSSLTVDFYSLYGGANISGGGSDQDIAVDNGGVRYVFTVSPGGEISSVRKEL